MAHPKHHYGRARHERHGGDERPHRKSRDAADRVPRRAAAAEASAEPDQQARRNHLDIDRRDNTVRSHGLFKRWAPLELKAGLGMERTDRRTVRYMPVPLWNELRLQPPPVLRHSSGV